MNTRSFGVKLAPRNLESTVVVVVVVVIFVVVVVVAILVFVVLVAVAFVVSQDSVARVRAAYNHEVKGEKNETHTAA